MTNCEDWKTFSEQFMLFTESKAFRGQKMTMEELSTKLNILLAANDYPVLYEYKSYQTGEAHRFAAIEFDRYKARIGTTERKAIEQKPATTSKKRKKRNA